MHKRTPATVVLRQSRAPQKIILRDFSRSIAAIKAAGVDYDSKMSKAGERERFAGAIPAAIALLVDDIGKLAIGNSAVEIAVREQLCRHRNREQSQTNQCQHRRSSLRHELFLPGGCAGKKAHLINEIC